MSNIKISCAENAAINRLKRLQMHPGYESFGPFSVWSRAAKKNKKNNLNVTNFRRRQQQTVQQKAVCSFECEAKRLQMQQYPTLREILRGGVGLSLIPYFDRVFPTTVTVLGLCSAGGTTRSLLPSPSLRSCLSTRGNRAVGWPESDAGTFCALFALRAGTFH